MSGVSVVSLVITLLGMAVAPVLANKLGKKNVFLAGIIVAVGGFTIRFIDVRSLLLIYVGAVFAGIGGGFIGPLAYGIQADNTRAPPSFEVYSMKLKIQEVYDGKEKRFLQSINFW